MILFKILNYRYHFEVKIFVKKQSQELTRVNPDQNIFSINVELTSTFLLYRGLVHHHHRVFKLKLIWSKLEKSHKEIQRKNSLIPISLQPSVQLWFLLESDNLCLKYQSCKDIRFRNLSLRLRLINPLCL